MLGSVLVEVMKNKAVFTYMYMYNIHMLRYSVLLRRYTYLL